MIFYSYLRYSEELSKRRKRMNDKEAIVLLKRDSHEAFEYLYRQYNGQVYHFTKLYIHSSEEAKEVVQEIFVKLWETRSFLKEDENFKGYLFIITRNLIFNQQKKKFNDLFYKTTILNAFDESNIDPFDIEEELQAKELKVYIDSLIKELPPKQQEIFILSRRENLSYKEIGERLHISERTVEVHISRALRYMKKNIALFLIFLTNYPQ